MIAPNAAPERPVHAGIAHAADAWLPWVLRSPWRDAILLVVMAGAWWIPETAIDAGPALCNFRRWTGLPCPGCGFTRAFVHMAHGHVVDAFAANAFGPLLFVVAVGVVGADAIAWALGRRVSLTVVARRVRKPALVAAVAWVVWGVARAVAVAIGRAG